jgi:hypothetical protein
MSPETDRDGATGSNASAAGPDAREGVTVTDTLRDVQGLAGARTRWRWPRAAAIALALFAAALAARGQDAEPREPRGAARTATDIARLADSMRSLGPWEEQYRDIERAMDNLWRQNGWNDEADLFARRLMHEVARIPPWDFAGRVAKARELTTERYRLSEQQGNRMQGVFLREIGKLMLRNAPVIMRQGNEYIETRSQGRPFTAEQMVRWTEETEPFMRDIFAAHERIVADIRRDLSDEQREIFDRDIVSAEKRLTYWVEKRRVWEKGGWKAEDWGMQDDPMQSGAGATTATTGAPAVAEQPAAKAERDPATPSAAPRTRPVGPWLEHDPATWHAYLAFAKERYRFDTAQALAADSIYVEIMERASARLESLAEVIQAVPVPERGQHEALAPLRALFQELAERVVALATDAQRKEPAPPRAKPAPSQEPSPSEAPDPSGAPDPAPSPPV